MWSLSENSSGSERALRASWKTLKSGKKPNQSDALAHFRHLARPTGPCISTQKHHGVKQSHQATTDLSFHAPPAALPIGRPRPPCASLRSGGGQTWRWVFGWRFALLEGRAEGVTSPPRLRRCPPEWGETGGLLGVGFLRRGASRFAMSFMRVPTRTSTPKSSPRSPPHLGGSAER